MTSSCWQPVLHWQDPYALLFHFTRLFSEYMMWIDSPHHELVYPCIGELSAVVTCMNLLENKKLKKAIDRFQVVWKSHIYKKDDNRKTITDLRIAGEEIIQRLTEFLQNTEPSLNVVSPVVGEKK